MDNGYFLWLGASETEKGAWMDAAQNLGGSIPGRAYAQSVEGERGIKAFFAHRDATEEERNVAPGVHPREQTERATQAYVGTIPSSSIVGDTHMPGMLRVCDTNGTTIKLSVEDMLTAVASLAWLRNLDNPVEIGGTGRGQCFFCGAIYYHDSNDPHAPDCIWKRAQVNE
jgi:hypothetical protein